MAIQLEKLVVPALLTAGAVFLATNFLPSSIASAAAPIGVGYAMGHLARDSLNLLLSTTGDLGGIAKGLIGAAGFAVCSTLYSLSSSLFTQRYGLQGQVSSLAVIVCAAMGFIMLSDRYNNQQTARTR